MFHATSDLNDEPPTDIVCNTKGLSKQRARLARYVAWKQQEDHGLKELEARRADIEAKVEKAEAEIKDAVQRTADSLLSGADVGDDTRVMAARHLAEAARVALPELLKKLERAQARVKRLAERENEFLRAALFEIAEASGIGDRYMKALAEMRHVVGLVFGFHRVHGQGPQFREHVAFPQSILTSGEHRDYVISSDDIRDSELLWSEIAKTLRSDPCAKVSVPK
jgi:uncharacterized protein YlxW (UPF0749 family)